LDFCTYEACMFTKVEITCNSFEISTSWENVHCFDGDYAMHPIPSEKTFFFLPNNICYRSLCFKLMSDIVHVASLPV
jgi:hypothetical protein